MIKNLYYNNLLKNYFTKVGEGYFDYKGYRYYVEFYKQDYYIEHLFTENPSRFKKIKNSTCDKFCLLGNFCEENDILSTLCCNIDPLDKECTKNFKLVITSGVGCENNLQEPMIVIKREKIKKAQNLNNDK